MVSKFSVDLWKRFGEAVIPSDAKKFHKSNNSLIIRCDPQTALGVLLCCCDWGGAVQAARTGCVCETRGQGISRNRAALQVLGIQEQAGQAEKGTVRTQQSGNGKVTSQVSSQSRRAKQQFMSSREWDRILHRISWAGKNGSRFG